MKHVATFWVVTAALALAACSGNGNGNGTPDGAGAGDVVDQLSEGVAADVPVTPPDGLPEDGAPEDVVQGEAGYDLWLLDLDQTTVEELSLYSVDPTKGKTIGGDQVVLSGSGFQTGMVVRFGYQEATDVYVLSGKKATAITPAGLPGPANVEVLLPDGRKATLEKGFLYFNPVSITSIEPAAGPTAGGVPVMVMGTGFSGNPALVIGKKIAIDTKIMDDTTLLAVAPSGVPGPADVSVSSVEGLSTLIGGFFYYDYPDILEVTPAAGPASGGAVVHLKLKGAHPDAQVFFGELPAAQVTFVDWERLEVITPPAEVGFVSISVTTPYGSDSQANGYYYFGGNVPPLDLQVLSLQPSSGPTSGGNVVQISAFGLTETADTTVFFGKKVAQVADVLPSLMQMFVVAPAGAEGTVDVTVMNSNGTAVVPGGYKYLPIATVEDVTPGHGPAAGGNSVLVSGQGFLPDAKVVFGALPASGVKVLSSTQISAVAPMGSPGEVDVFVEQAGTQAVLPAGYTYDGPLQALVVNPNFGSISGGTFITIVGSGFAEGVKVSVGGAPCSHVTVLSYNVVTAKTPPGPAGTVDVTVALGDASDVLPSAFTYFDPVSFYGGTWGGLIQHSVNVTVLDGNSGAPLPDAFVMLWANPDTPYQGYTDLNGQVTFSGPDLMGEQMVTASKECYSNSSVVEYNATNVTLYISYNCPSMGGGMPPPFVPPKINGRVWGFGKYVVIPPGPCNYTGFDFPFLCQPCSTDGDCGSPDNLCANLGNQGKHCLTACQDDAECPLGYSCTSIQGGGDGFGHCLPLGGKKIILCSTTKGHILAAKPSNGPDSVADAEGNFTLLYEGLGEVAVVCLGGVLPICQSQFDCTFGDSVCLDNGCWMPDGTPEMTPWAMGVYRHINLTASGQVVNDVNLQVDIPMNRKVTVFFDEPHLNPMGPNVLFGLSFLELGSDGVFEFIEFPLKWYFEEETTVTFEHLPSSLTGSIAGSTFSLFGASVTAGTDGTKLPRTFALQTGLEEFEDDKMFIKGEQGWKTQSSGVKKNLYGLWGPSFGDVYGVGTDGTVAHFNGTSWSIQQSPATTTLRAVHGADGEVWAVGEKGGVFRFQGTKWEQVTYNKINNLKAVWAAAKTFVVVAGEYTIDLWDGAKFSPMPGNTGHRFYAVWGINSKNVWAVGEFGKIVRLVNGVWQNQASGTSHTLRAVWGTGPTDVWAAGDGGAVVHFDGEAWTVVDSGTLAKLNAIAGSGPLDVTFAGNKGAVLRWDGQAMVKDDAGTGQDILALFADGETGQVIASGNHQVVLGPFVTPAGIVHPTDGAAIEQNFLQWQWPQGGPDASFNYVTLEQPSMAGPIMFWDFMAAGDVTYVDLPDFPNISGTPGVPAGFYIYTVQKVWKEGFDIDNYSFLDLDYRSWRSWSPITANFTSE